MIKLGVNSMKRSIYISLLIAVCGCSLQNANAMESKIFTTISEAEEYCPNVAAISYQKLYPNTPNGAVSIEAWGTNGSQTVRFASYYKTNLHPAGPDDDEGLLPDVTFRKVGDYYGYISNGYVTCLYSYPGFTGLNVALIMRSQN